ncbi:hypothetical protein NA56DRAFT_753751 [Hyaloscypha hepaticicola]|uniref:Uncharacterized protein n=1 Tax=Hyaloscypha hepaticicola TaxID=2082293 RepID=A0A2J6PNU6_9HELO|nr:hypothetical protein NA56DRAFT_753751 [Hyaloscypha hepaticicola]
MFFVCSRYGEPLRQLFPDPKSSSDVIAKVEYVTRPSYVILLTPSSIIAVHGLNPRSKNDTDHAWATWRTPSGAQGCLWLRDDLPQYVSESRIFLYEYNATAVYGKDKDTFIGKANELLEAIRIERDESC